MVKTSLVIFWFVALAVSAQAQNRANIWELGDHGQPINPSFYIDFSNGNADTFSIIRPMDFYITDASFCDTAGHLILYTNGVYIANRNHDTLMNCGNFNPGYWTDFYGSGGMGIPQGALILPKPGSANLYGVFSVTGENSNYHGKTYAPLHLSYSSVDMNLDSGLGGIVSQQKNIHVITDTISWGRLTACKHANGRDWWIITHKFYTDQYYKVLFTPDSLKVFTQQIGNSFNSYDLGGMAVFSPDGSFYAQVNINDTIDLLQFDRCSGDFYNPVTLVVPDTPVTLSATLGCQFSPNSRFLYVNSYRRLWQFDTWANDVQASMLLIDTIDPLTIYPLFLEQSAPDGKIYLSTFNTSSLRPFLHVINNPDSLGSLCDVVFDGFILPPICGNFCVPNFTNYDLGPLLGSTCDTLYNSVQQTITTPPFSISPIPSHTYIIIVYSVKVNSSLTFTDAYGRQVKQLTLYPYFKNRMVYVDDLAAGMYFVQLKTGIKVWVEKMVKE